MMNSRTWLCQEQPPLGTGSSPESTESEDQAHASWVPGLPPSRGSTAEPGRPDTCNKTLLNGPLGS